GGGSAVASDADLLIHDAQYTAEEYQTRVGWGHSRITDAIAFARLAGVKQLVPFHHEPEHTDNDLDHLFEAAITAAKPSFLVTPGKEGAVFELRTPAYSPRPRRPVA